VETTRLHFVYDAWNRLVEVKADSGGQPGAAIATYQYDGRGFRTRKVLAGGGTFDYYYNEAHQVVEVRGNGDADAYEQYVWDARYIDAPVMIYRDTNTDGVVDQRLYVMQDANFNTTATLNGSTGAVQNRFTYTPYGRRTVLNSAWQAATTDVTLGHQGLSLDAETGLYYNRARMLHPTLGTFTGRDPLGYVDGGSLYQYEAGSAIAGLDPSGYWRIERNANSAWATAHVEDGDTFEQLARSLRLVTDERTKWLRRETPDGRTVPIGEDENAASACRYKVPNTVVVYTSKQGQGFWEKNSSRETSNQMRQRAIERGKEYQAKGYHIVWHLQRDDSVVFKTMWGADGIYAVAFGGHGGGWSNKVRKGAVKKTLNDVWVGYNTGDGDTVGPSEVAPPYHLQAVYAYACGTANPAQLFNKKGLAYASWADHVSGNGGGFLGYFGAVDSYDDETIIGVVGVP
jgi:RHS repeat-associated protein